ncbi:bis(5'-nucleosyl)-tetraphosphatase [Pseudomonadota bacterium]
MNEKTIYERSAGVVLFREGNGKRLYLVLHYPGGHFDLAKGHVEPGETDLQAAERELMEETGIENVELIDGYSETINYKYNRGPILVDKDVIFFLGKTDKEEIVISFEHRDSIWLPYEEAYAKVTFQNAKDLIKKAEEHLKGGR